jgi:hypothetical protein
MENQEIVDPIEQLATSLHWEEEYTDEYKRRVLVEFLKFTYSEWQKGAL